MPSTITGVTLPSLLPSIPVQLAETGALPLEWPRLREHLAGRTISPLGRAWVLALEPSADLAWITAQHDRTAEIVRLLEGGGSFSFHGLFDATDLLEKARVEGAALEALELLALLAVAERVAAWRALLAPDAAAARDPQRARTDLPAIATLSASLLDRDLAPLLRALRGKIEPDGGLADDASPELRRIRRAMERQHRTIEESLRRAARSLRDEGATQQDTDTITIRGERFVIPVKAEWKRRVPGVVHGSSSTGQTVFVEPLETIEQNNELVRLLDEEQAEIHRILVALTRAVAAEADTLALGTSILAEVESHFARAKFSRDLHCTRPAFFPAISGESLTELVLEEARHPLLELRMRTDMRSGRPRDTVNPDETRSAPPEDLLASAEQTSAAPPTPVPLTLRLAGSARELIISGPNTGGKTVSLKTLGLLTLMAQAGIPVPAAHATLPLVTSVFADIGDAQSIERNLSSFSAHIVNLDRITRNATPTSLVLLDELGSATDPEEGAALAVAIAGRFLTLNAWTVITTHLTSLKVFAANHPGVANAAVGFDTATLAPTYQLRLGVPGASAGLNIAARLGLDPDIVADARAQLTTQTADIGAFLDQLHAQLAEATTERATLRRREHELRLERERLDREGRLEQKQRTRELEQKLESLLDDFDVQLKDTVKAIDDKTVAQKIARDSALRMSRLRREFSDQFKGTVLAHTNRADQDPNAGPHRKSAPRPTQPGDLVRLRSLGREARVARIVDPRTLEVEIGAMKMRVPLTDVAETTPVAVLKPADATRRRGNITVQTTQTSDYVPMELNVIGRRAEEAEDDVARYIDQAFLAGLPRVRIVHGTGMGVLRRTLRDFLRTHPHVTNITEPPHNEGGQGATVVDLRQ